MTGHCNICGWSGTFRLPENAREGLLCGNCSSSSRHRAVIHALSRLLARQGSALFAWPADKGLTILESSARGSYPSILGDKFTYYATEYDPEKIAHGTDPERFADFQRLHFSDASFDLVIASDVFEHVREDAEAYRQVFRVLKPGGTLILTVPYDHTRAETIRRVDTSGPEDLHLLEPEYHGGGGQTLAYRNYGRDLLRLLRQTGFAVCHLDLEIPGGGISRQSVFLCTKAEAVTLSDPPVDGRPPVPLGPLLPFRMFLLVKYNVKGFLHYVREVLHR